MGVVGDGGVVGATWIGSAASLVVNLVLLPLIMDDETITSVNIA